MAADSGSAQARYRRFRPMTFRRNAGRGGGRNLQQELRCASDSYKFEVSSNVVHDGVAISGVWSETTRNVSGNVSGQARAGQIQARVDGLGFSATLGVATSGNSQSVMI